MNNEIKPALTRLKKIPTNSCQIAQIMKQSYLIDRKYNVRGSDPFILEFLRPHKSQDGLFGKHKTRPLKNHQ